MLDCWKSGSRVSSCWKRVEAVCLAAAESGSSVSSCWKTGWKRCPRWPPDSAGSACPGWAWSPALTSPAWRRAAAGWRTGEPAAAVTCAAPVTSVLAMTSCPVTSCSAVTSSSCRGWSGRCGADLLHRCCCCCCC